MGTQKSKLPQTVDELHALIAAQHNELSARLKLVAVYLVEHPQQVSFSTLAEIAKQAGVHASTLVRFASHFGFSGFSELQKLYKNQILQNPSNYRERISQLKSTQGDAADTSPASLLHEFIDGNQLALSLLEQQVSPEILEAAVETLNASKDVYICGIRRVYPVAVYLNFTLSQMGVRCSLIDDQGGMLSEQAKWMNKESTLIGMTFSPYGSTPRAVVEQAKEQGSKIILITDSELCPLAPLADQLFIVREAEVRAFRSLNSMFCLAQTLCVALGFRKSS
ncbi:MurR/RpiR family transcriptional regulator [Leucothrix sargassi]|nr:MurR/RpiR family transcriptional regulator [Leucothrix sargassi]